MTTPISAYFVGGPKHGDIDLLSAAAQDMYIPLAPARHVVTPIVNEGHYSYTAPAVTYKKGRYRRECELYGMPDTPGNRRAFLFMWVGAV